MSKRADDRGPPEFTYGDICSGVSAPTLAAQHLGWETKFFSEIEAFPRAVLKHRYPDTPLHADFTTITRDTYGTVDLLVGGTPCQSFSVAGKRLGLDDPRGNLALEYVCLAERLDAQWLVFENVPGLLSSAGGEDFATFISAVTGFEYRPPATGWQNAGIAVGKSDRWGVAWRILDAQYFGVAQRRRRLFVVGHRGDWRPAAAVLLEPESMRGDLAPRREKGQNVAGTLEARASTGGYDPGAHEAASGHLIAGINPGSIVPYNIVSGGQNGKNHAYQTDVSGCLQHKGLAATGNEAGTLIASTGELSHCLNAGGMGRQDYETETFIAHTLRGDGFDASEDGTGRGTPLVPVAYGIRSDASRNGEAITPSADATGKIRLRNPGLGIYEELAPTIDCGSAHSVALSLRGRDGGGTAELSGDVMPALRASQGGGDKPHVLMPSAVRRLTPTECERLQGMPDDYTQIPWRNKPAAECPDGPRYKAVGNSMAVPVMSWIFNRVEAVRKGLS